MSTIAFEERKVSQLLTRKVDVYRSAFERLQVMVLLWVFGAGLTLVVPSSASSRGKLLSHAASLAMALVNGRGEVLARYTCDAEATGCTVL